MDTYKSQWSKYAPRENIFPTDKKFFQKYYYKAQLEVPCGHFVRDALYRKLDSDTFKAFTKINITRMLQVMEDNGGSSILSRWNKERVEDLEAADIDLIASLYDIVMSRGKKIRHRIEGKTFSIYAEDEQDLRDILESSPLIKSAVTHIYCPISEDAKLKLDDKVIFVRSVPQFKYRITVTEAKYERTTLTQLHNYISNFPGEIKLPPTMMGRLSPTLEYDAYVYGYFYINDLSVLTFMKMISHKFVKEIYKLEHSPL
jgi:hypothetical protein